MDWVSYNKTVESMENMAKQGAALNFETFGNVMPVAFLLVTRDLHTGRKIPPTVTLVPLDFSSEEAKDITANVLHKLVDAAGAIAIVIVAEVWYVPISDVTEGPLPRPSESPDRKECLMAHVETLLGTRSFMAEIVRRPDGSGVLGPWKLSELGYGSGRMTGFIKPISTGKA